MRSPHILLALFALSLIPPPVFAHAIGGSAAQFVRNTVGADPFPFLYLGAKHMVTGYDHLLFLLVQSRLDDRDPKLRTAMRSQGDLLVGFEDDPS